MATSFFLLLFLFCCVCGNERNPSQARAKHHYHPSVIIAHPHTPRRTTDTQPTPTHHTDRFASLVSTHISASTPVPPVASLYLGPLSNGFPLFRYYYSSIGQQRNFCSALRLLSNNNSGGLLISNRSFTTHDLSIIVTYASKKRIDDDKKRQTKKETKKKHNHNNHNNNNRLTVVDAFTRLTSRSVS